MKAEEQALALADAINSIKEYAIVMLDAEGVIETWSQGAEHLYGYSEEEALGKPLSTFFQAEPTVFPQLFSCAKEKGEYGADILLLHKNKSSYLAKIALTSVYNPVSQLESYISIVHLSNRKNADKLIDKEEKHEGIERSLKEMTENLQLALDAAKAGTWHWDIQTNAIIWDKTLYQLFGLPVHKEIRGYEDYMEYIYPEDREPLAQAIQLTLKEGVPLDIEHRVVWPDGSIHVISGRGNVYYDEQGRPKRMVGVSLDITQRKQLEKEAATATQKQRESELKAQQALQDQKLQEDFFDTLCHEIGNTGHGVLNSVESQEGALRALKELLPNISADPELKRQFVKLEESLHIVRECSLHQQRVINHALTLSDIDTGRLSIQSKPFSISDAVKGIVRSYQAQAEATEINIFLELPESTYFVESDVEHLKQILSHLLSNAIKYTPPKGFIKITLIVEPDGTEVGIRIIVQNTGSGFNAKEQEELFSRFSQMTRNKQSKYDASGLGLVISKALVNMLGGEISVESEKTRGSTFTLSFRWKLAPAYGQRSTGGSAFFSIKTEEKPDKILIVDDIEVNQKLLIKMLKKLGYKNLKTANNGNEAVEAFKSFHPKIIFMDIEMPEKNGIEATREIRAIEDPPAAPVIIAVTGYTREEYKKHAEAAGMDGYIEKPFKKQAIQEILEIKIEMTDSAVKPFVTIKSPL